MTSPASQSTRSLSVRTRFEIFKRDGFTCQYCGLKSPEVVLEVDHIIPVCQGGNDDVLNLITACWACNSGKAGVALDRVMTSEDPHDKAIESLERQRQLDEYNRVIAEERERREAEVWDLWQFWQAERGYTSHDDLNSAPHTDLGWLRASLGFCPREQIREFMILAIGRRAIKNLKYVAVCVRNWRYEHQANQDTGRDDA
jgi:Restriction endonuclease